VCLLLIPVIMHVAKYPTLSRDTEFSESSVLVGPQCYCSMSVSEDAAASSIITNQEWGLTRRFKILKNANLNSYVH